jgi:hypothetical protein
LKSTAEAPTTMPAKQPTATTIKNFVNVGT